MMKIFTDQEKPRLIGANLPYKRTWFMSLLLLLKVLNKKFNGQMRIVRRELANIFPGNFRGCIGVGDVKEYQIEKPKDRIKEKRSWSGEKN